MALTLGSFPYRSFRVAAPRCALLLEGFKLPASEASCVVRREDLNPRPLAGSVAAGHLSAHMLRFRAHSPATSQGSGSRGSGEGRQSRHSFTSPPSPCRYRSAQGRTMEKCEDPAAVEEASREELFFLSRAMAVVLSSERQRSEARAMHVSGLESPTGRERQRAARNGRRQAIVTREGALPADVRDSGDKTVLVSGNAATRMASTIRRHEG